MAAALRVIKEGTTTYNAVQPLSVRISKGDLTSEGSATESDAVVARMLEKKDAFIFTEDQQTVMI